MIRPVDPDRVPAAAATPDFGGAHVRIDAWTGTQAPASPLSPRRDGWAVRPAAIDAGAALFPRPPDPANWRDERIGWGLILPDRDDFTPEQKARDEDICEPLRALLADRPASKVLRYRRTGAFEGWVLRDYASGGDRPIATAKIGTGPADIPAYLLIVASPKEIPWTLQYQLNLVRKVGRLDLPPDGLANYVNALIGDWSDSAARYASPVVWAADHGEADITRLMRDAIADPVHTAFRADDDVAHGTFVDGRTADATVDALTAALLKHRPAIVVTTSHGQTGPLDQPDIMAERLGALVDNDHEVLDWASLLQRWQPDGAIWFAQACCSAGTDRPSSYQGMFDDSSDVGGVLAGVATVGPRVAPLPTALLGAARPLRAFIGHVEPTFDWTMLFPPTLEQLTGWVCELLYTGLCGGSPVGLALENARLYNAVGALLLQHSRAVARFATAKPAARRPVLDLALYSKVSAYDRAGTVLLGDPTVAVAVPAEVRARSAARSRSPAGPDPAADVI
jgi:hypothetical protein